MPNTMKRVTLESKDTAKERYKVFKKKYEEARKELNQQASDAFKEFASEIFEEFPALESFGWVQFTPYFNDGDVCEFRANTDYTDGIYINGANEYEEERSCPKCDAFLDNDAVVCSGCGKDVSKVQSKMTADEQEKARKCIVKMMKDFDDDILLDLYDDHAKVTIMRNGKAKVEEYEHE